MVVGVRRKEPVRSRPPRSMRVLSSIVRLFPNPTLPAVLSLLCLHPDGEFYQREIVEQTGGSTLQVQRALKRIEQAGLLRKSRRGNRVYYSAEVLHPAFSDLKNTLLKTAGLADLLREALAPLSSRVTLAFVFGSIAVGKESGASDIDLMVVGEVGNREVIKALGPTTRRIGREFNPVVLKNAEFRVRIAREDHFLGDVLRSPKIWLIGREDDIPKVA